MNNKFVLTNIKNVNTGFLIEDGKVNEIRCYEEDSLIGNIYVGRVSNILPNINAAFIDIKKGYSCYYSLEEYKGDKKLKKDDLILCQVVKDAIKTKQPVVTTNISITGEYAVASSDGIIGVSAKIKDKELRSKLKVCASDALSVFYENIPDNERNGDKARSKVSFGLVMRTSCEEIASVTDSISDSEITNEIKILLDKLSNIYEKAVYATAYSCLHKGTTGYIKDALYMLSNSKTQVMTDIKDMYVAVLDEIIAGKQEIQDLKSKLVLYEDDLPLYALFNLNRTIEKALNKVVYLKSGASLIIEHTEAMTVIDVNSGKSIKKNDAAESMYKINCEAAKEIARQLRLRNVSGIIIVDFINMKNDSYEKMLMDKLKEYVSDDMVPVQVVDITRLGLVEMTRKKQRKSINQIFV